MDADISCDDPPFGGIAPVERGSAVVPSAASWQRFHGRAFEGWIVGTPALMPPEQVRGDPGAIDARADIYALGATLLLLLCGRYPFEGDSAVDVLMTAYWQVLDVTSQSSSSGSSPSGSGPQASIPGAGGSAPPSKYQRNT